MISTPAPESVQTPVTRAPDPAVPTGEDDVASTVPVSSSPFLIRMVPFCASRTS
ncbi:hypothetical protein [Actinomadura madurae]|uniref:hypothetical protein n=1 Tax=Actinomadura madurae TaxID=1993 RepID=UPI0020D206D3|nr:hypothetical protein [Actinomadura madurae]MCP9979433.1 hypothetical protein [Actinomadura madurae]